MSAFAEFARTRRPFPALTPDDEANLRFCCRTIIEGYTAKLYPAYWNLVRWVCRNPFRFLTALRIVRRHRHLRLNPPPHPSAEDWKRTNEILRLHGTKRDLADTILEGANISSRLTPSELLEMLGD